MILSRMMAVVCICMIAPVLQAQKSEPKKAKDPPMLDGLKALQHPDANVRYKAAHTLAEVGPLAKFAVPALRELLKDKSVMVRIKAAEALWKVDKTPTTVLMPVLLPALRDKSASVRAAAPPVIALFGTKAKSALPVFVEMLEDKDLTVKLAVVVALGDLGPLARDTVDELLALGKDKEFFLLEPFVGATLSSLGPDVVPTLARALADKSPERRRLAAYALGSMEDAGPAAPALAGALKAEDATTRKLAARALGKLGPAAKQTLPALEAALSDKDVSVRIEAALSAWRVSGNARSVTVLTAALADDSAYVRQGACQAIGSMKSAAKEAVPAVMKMLNDKELRVRGIITLGELGLASNAALPSLRALVNDKDGEVSLSAAFSIWQIAGENKEAIKILTKGLESEFHDRLAMRLLGEMGEAAKSALPTLVTMYREEEVAVYRETLAIAIKKIDASTATKLGIK